MIESSQKGDTQSLSDDDYHTKELKGRAYETAVSKAANGPTKSSKLGKKSVVTDDNLEPSSSNMMYEEDAEESEGRKQKR